MNMFYDKDQVDFKLICLNCSERFDVPKLLPCGDSICLTCLKSILSKSTNSKSFTCPFCHEDLQIPSNGEFPTQKLLIEILQMRPKKVYRGKLFEDTCNLIAECEKSFEDFLIFAPNMKDVIKGYCEKLRSEIKAVAASPDDKLALIDEVTNYEQRCLENLNKPSLQREYMLFIRSLAKNELDSIKHSFKNSEVTDELIQNWYDHVKFMNSCLENCKSFAESLLFCNAQVRLEMFYVENKDNPSIRHKKLQLVYDEFNYQDILNIEFLVGTSAYSKFSYETLLLNSTDHVIHNVWLSILNSENLIICLYVRYFHWNNFGIHMKLMDKNGTILRENCENTNCELITILATEKEILLAIKNAYQQYQVQLYNLDLQLGKFATLDYKPLSLHRTVSYIYVLSEKIPFVHVYDWNLNKVKQFGQNSNPNEPYYMLNVTQIFIKINRIFVRDSDNLTVKMLSLYDGKLIGVIDVNTNDCLMYVDFLGRLIVINQDSKILYIYDTNDSKILFEYDLTYIRDVSSFSITYSGHLIINDTTEKIIYII